MAFPYRLTRDDIVYIDGRAAKFHCELPEDRAQFLDAESFLAVTLSADELRAKFRARTFRFSSFRSVPVELRNDAELTLDHFPEDARFDMHRRKEYTEAVDALGVSGQSKKAIEDAIERVAFQRNEKVAPHYKTVLKWVATRGASNGRLLTAMRTKNDKKGGHSSLSSLQNRIISEAIEDVYRDKRQLPGDAVWSHIVTQVNTMNQGLPDECRLKRPSKATVYRRIRKYRDYLTTRLRKGADVANKIFRWVGEMPEVDEINDLWIADATTLDNMIVLDTERMVVLGKPTFTDVEDLKSRKYAGFYLGFEPPSHLSMALAIRHAIGPKSDKETIKPDGSRRTFAEGVPHNLLLDNGLENGSESMKDALGSLGVNVVFAPIKDPQYKGPKERLFHTLNTLLIQRLPGVTKIGAKRSSEFGIDPQKDAIITLDFLNELILDAIDIYHSRFHTGILAAPDDAWKRGLQQTRIELPASLDSLNVLLGRLKVRTLDRKGIRFAGLRYGSNDVTFLLDQLLPRSPERDPSRVKVKIKYDPGDLGCIWVFNPVTDRYVELPCLRQRYAAGLTLHHHKQILANARLEHRKLHSEDDLCAAKVALRLKVEAAFGGKLLRDKKRAARITTVQNRRFVGDVLKVYDEANSSLSTLDQSLEETILLDREPGERFDDDISNESPAGLAVAHTAPLTSTAPLRQSPPRRKPHSARLWKDASTPVSRLPSTSDVPAVPSKESAAPSIGLPLLSGLPAPKWIRRS